MPEDSLDIDLTTAGGENRGVSADLQRPSQRRRIARLEASLDGLLTRLSEVGAGMPWQSVRRSCRSPHGSTGSRRERHPSYPGSHRSSTR
jgi:hypothetical protein